MWLRLRVPRVGLGGRLEGPEFCPAGQPSLTIRGLGDSHQLEWESPEAHSLQLMGNFILHPPLVYLVPAL